MRRGRELLGVKVYPKTRTQKGPIAEVTDILVSIEGEVIGLVVAPLKGILRKERTIPIGHVDLSSTEKVLLRSTAPLTAQAHEADVQGVRVYAVDGGLCGLPIFSEDGEEIGTVGDVVFDEEQGGKGLWLWGFEVSDGLLKDLLDGRPVVEAAGAHVEGEGIVLKSRARAHMMLMPKGHPSPEGSG